MNKIKIAFTFSLLSFVIFSCKKDDKIENKICPSGYTGLTCTTPWNDGLAGDWSAKYISTTGSSSADITIRVDATDPKKFYIDHFLAYYSDVACVMTSSNSFEYMNTVTGTGTITQNNTIMSGHFDGGGNGCDYTFTKK